MKYLLTSAGIKNPSIYPQVSPGNAWRFISGREPNCPMCELGWKSLGVLELTALPSIDQERWIRWVRETDVLLVNGGDTIWIGLSAGRLVLTPTHRRALRQLAPAHRRDSTLGVVDFSIFPHLDHEMLPEKTMADA